jgi:hypothetical protein
MAPVVGGGETEREPEPYCMDEAGNRVVEPTPTRPRPQYVHDDS